MTTLDFVDRHTAVTAARRKAQRTYDMAADCYDERPLGFWKRTGRATADRLRLQPGARVLDVGCGAGASALPAAAAVGPAGRVIGVDLSEKLLGIARRRAAEGGLIQAEFRRGDMTVTGFADGSFDAVISVFSVFFVPNMKGFVAELWRLVKPGGTLAVTTWGTGFVAPVYERFNDAVRRERPDLVSAFNPWDRITTPGAVATLFADAGIPRRHIAILAQDARQPLEDPEDWWTIVLGSGLRWTAEALGPDAAARVRADNVDWIRDNGVDSVAVNAIYATARKPE